MKSKYILLFAVLATFITLSCGDKQEEEQQKPLLGQPELITDGYQFTEGPFWHQDGNTSNPITFTNIGERTEKGGADGMKTDTDGNLYTTGPNGLLVFNSDGVQIDKSEFEEQITNLAWGGPNGNQLFLTASSNVYRFDVSMPE